MEEITSICCGAPMHSDLHGVCSRCKEHTGAIKECEECEGTGIAPFAMYGETCLVCAGEGIVEVEL